jgi:hypothetical protein
MTLNFRYGIMHQDIAPRNIVIGQENRLRIFDFNYSIMIGEHYTPDRDDVKGVIFTLYEIITLDEHYREVPHEQQDADAVLQLRQWTKHPEVHLDSDVEAFRDVLDVWVQKRRGMEYKLAKSWIRWPFIREPPPAKVPSFGPDGEITKIETKPSPVRARRHLVRMGERFWNWERPASYRMAESLGNGGKPSLPGED